MEIKFNGEKLKQLRLEYEHEDGRIGMTMKELAKATELSQASISYIENGVKEPKLETVNVFGRVLKINPIHFFLNEEIASEVFPTGTSDEIIKFATNNSNLKYLKMAMELERMGMAEDDFNSFAVMITQSRAIRDSLAKKRQ